MPFARDQSIVAGQRLNELKSIHLLFREHGHDAVLDDASSEFCESGTLILSHV